VSEQQRKKKKSWQAVLIGTFRGAALIHNSGVENLGIRKLDQYLNGQKVPE